MFFWKTDYLFPYFLLFHFRVGCAGSPIAHWKACPEELAIEFSGVCEKLLLTVWDLLVWWIGFVSSFSSSSVPSHTLGSPGSKHLLGHTVCPTTFLEQTLINMGFKAKAYSKWHNISSFSNEGQD